LIELPVAVVDGVHNPQPVPRLSGLQGVEQEGVQPVIRDHRHVRGQHLVEHMIRALVRRCEHEVAEALVVPQTTAVPDHHHGVRP
jgi:hypothetical protein